MRQRHVLGAAREWIAGLEAQERDRTGIRSLKVGYNKVFGYYLEVTRANAHLAPQNYIRKQTLVNAERYITPELKEKEELILAAEETKRKLARASMPAGDLSKRMVFLPLEITFPHEGT